MVDRKGVSHHKTFLQEQFKEITGTHVPEQESREEIDNISKEGLNAIQTISDLTTKINDIGNETVMRSAYAVAMLDGKMADSEYTFLFEVGKALEMTN